MWTVCLNKESGKTAVSVFLSLFHRRLRNFFLSTVRILDGRDHRRIVSVRMLRGSLGILSEKRHTKKRADQNGRGYADFIKRPHDPLQYDGHTFIAADRAGISHGDATRRLCVCPEASGG